MSTSLLRRQMKNIVHNFSEAEIKVREATSNDPWGPSSSQMSEISDLTYNVVACSEIMTMLWKRLNDQGKNWRHVYKAMTLLEYLLKTGSERVTEQSQENINVVKFLKEFRYIDKDSKDQGVNVREKAKHVFLLLTDETKLQEERAHALKTKEKMAQSTVSVSSTSATGRPGGGQALLTSYTQGSAIGAVVNTQATSNESTDQKSLEVPDKLDGSTISSGTPATNDPWAADLSSAPPPATSDPWGGDGTSAPFSTSDPWGTEAASAERQTFSSDPWGRDDAPAPPSASSDPWGGGGTNVVQAPSSDPWGADGLSTTTTSGKSDVQEAGDNAVSDPWGQGSADAWDSPAMTSSNADPWTTPEAPREALGSDDIWGGSKELSPAHPDTQAPVRDADGARANTLDAFDLLPIGNSLPVEKNT